MSYRRYVKTMITQALRSTFDESYPVQDFATQPDGKGGVHASIEYPVDQQHYPGIWVGYSDTQKLQRAGIDHHEVSGGVDGTLTPFSRWRFGGAISLTIVALSSLERDSLFDEVVRVVAFGPENDYTRRFRDYIENNDFVAANIDFDEVDVQGDNAAPGTPWGTDEIIYEVTLSLDILGEFLADQSDGSLVPLSRILVEVDQVDSGLVSEVAPDGESPTDWH